MQAFDIEAIRARFPALALTHEGQPMAFFDGPGGTQVPQSVIDAVSGYYREANANRSGAFLTSRRTEAIVRDAHAALGDLLGVDGTDITIGPNMTTLTFGISRSIGATLRPGDELVVTGLDHQANVDPWITAARDNEAIVRTWEPDLGDCTLSLDVLQSILTDRTRLVAVGWASNAVGTINPIRKIADVVHRAGALLYVDAVHAAPHIALDAVAVGADFVACSVYKFFGPHLGALYGRREVLETLPIYKVRPSHDGFETGTANHEGDAGAAAAVEYLADLGVGYGGAYAAASRRERVLAGMRAIRAYEVDLYRYLAGRLGEIPGVRIFGLTADDDMERRTPTAAITIDGVTPRAAAEELGGKGIAVWHGDFYATGLIERLGFGSTGVLRIGLTHYNTRAEVDRLIEALSRIAGGRRVAA